MSQNLELSPYLAHRFLHFANGIIHLCRSLDQTFLTPNLLDQLIRCSCLMYSHYEEARERSPHREFYKLIQKVREECQESVYWLEILAQESSDQKHIIQEYIQEAVALRQSVMDISVDDSKEKLS